MENTTSMGMNRTGLQMAPLSKDDMVDFANAQIALVPTERGACEAILRLYVEEADAVGSVPIPGTLKGMATTGMAKLTGDKPEVFIDKLGERLAFERTGTRLYEAMIAKCEALEGRGATASGSPDGMKVGAASGARIDLQLLRRIRDDEEAHFNLVQSALLELGADPTAMTPCADVAGVMSLGLLQTVSDPRTNVPQCLNAILSAEMTDNAGWELLIELARELGHDDMAGRFTGALSTELQHLELIKGWLRKAIITEAS